MCRLLIFCIVLPHTHENSVFTTNPNNKKQSSRIHCVKFFKTKRTFLGDWRFQLQGQLSGASRASGGLHKNGKVRFLKINSHKQKKRILKKNSKKKSESVLHSSQLGPSTVWRTVVVAVSHSYKTALHHMTVVKFTFYVIENITVNNVLHFG